MDHCGLQIVLRLSIESRKPLNSEPFEVRYSQKGGGPQDLRHQMSDNVRHDFLRKRSGALASVIHQFSVKGICGGTRATPAVRVPAMLDRGVGQYGPATSIATGGRPFLVAAGVKERPAPFGWPPSTEDQRLSAPRMASPDCRRAD